MQLHEVIIENLSQRIQSFKKHFMFRNTIGQIHTLGVLNVVVADAGSYKCLVSDSNDGTSADSFVDVSVQGTVWCAVKEIPLNFCS